MRGRKHEIPRSDFREFYSLVQQSSMFIIFLLWVLAHFFACVQGINFPYESIQLTDADVRNYSAIAFGGSPRTYQRPDSDTPSTSECKVFPGDAGWPSDAQWQKFNETLGGVLILGLPPARVCYPGYYNASQCAAVKANYFNSRFRNDDPVEIVNEWLDGDSCPPSSYSNGTVGNLTTATCNLGAYPAYVVNVTTVKRKEDL